MSSSIPPESSKSTSSNGTASSNTASEAEILDALSTPMPRVKTTLFYRVGLALVASGMILLPLLYLALVAGIGAIVYWHATTNGTDLDSKGEMFLFLSPIIAGGVTVFFLLKPFFARRRHESTELRLDPEDEPLLFEYVNRLCACVGAPAPSEIQVDNEVNASAHLRRGLLSVFRRDLVLTIGLPLAGGMSLRQFTGVMAHEFGHFAQGTGMAFQWIIRSVNMWFARMVYERDAWDQRLDKWAGEVDFRLTLLIRFTQGVIWVARRILAVFMWVGRGLSGFLSLEMEYDADRYMARVAGSDEFAKSMRQLLVLSQAAHWGEMDQSEMRHEGRVVDDIAGLVGSQVPVLLTRQKIVESFDEQLRDRKTSFLSTHPPKGRRIENAARENAEGLFQVEGPTSQVFADFAALCRKSTFHEYEHQYGWSELSPDQIVTVASIEERNAERERSLAAIRRFLAGNSPEVLRVYLPAEANTELPEEEEASSVAERWKAAYRSWQGGLREHRSQIERYAELSDQRFEATVLATLREAGCKIDKKRSSVLDGGGFDRINKDWSDATQALQPLTDAAEARLYSALRLSGKSSDPKFGVKLRVLAALKGAHVALDDLKLSRACLDGLLDQWEKKNEDEDYQEVVAEQVTRVRQGLWTVCNSLGDLPYPYEHSRGEISAQDHLVPSIPREGEGHPGEYYGFARAAYERADLMYYRLLGELAQCALVTEKKCGVDHGGKAKEHAEKESREIESTEA